MIESSEFYITTKSARIRCDVMSAEAMCSSLIQYENKQKFDLLCKNGCPNYEQKWSCPPFAPKYTDFVLDYQKILVVLLSTDLSQFSYIKNDYLKIKAANTILKSRVDKALRMFLSEGCHYISTGSCRMCKPCKCKLGLPCAHPNTMSYSFESLGINVSKMAEDLFSFKLQWYKRSCLPQYTSVVAGLLFNNSFKAHSLLDAFSYI